MKALKKVLLGALSVACVMSASVGLTACDSFNGKAGTDGKSAYEIWLENGHSGTETDFLEWLKGEKGDQGDQGPQGETGAEGKSAYEIWLANGYEGTEADFLEWLNGTAGVTGPQGAQGEQGRGIADMQIVDGKLVVTYTDGSTQVLTLPQLPGNPDDTEDPDEHIHTFGAWMEYHEPDTDNRGYIRVCSGCGYTDWKQEDYLDHEWTVVTTAPTCTSKGYDTKTCTICGWTERDNYTAKVAHTWSTQYSYDANYHWYACTVCGTAGEKTGHTEGDSCEDCGCPMTSTVGVVYDLSADGTYAEVIAYEGSASKVKIASTYNGVPVTHIYKKAFYEKYNITSVIIPDSVTSIGEYAFYDCSSLTSLVIPDSVTSIGDYAFYNCGLTSVVIGDGVTWIGNYAFRECRSLTSVVIGDSVTRIGWDAFRECRSLTSVVIPDSVTSIASETFYNCHSLTSVVIGDSVTSIGYKAFYGCSSLTSVVIPDSVTSIGQYAFSNCTNLRFTEYGNCKYLGNENNPYHALIRASNNNYNNYTIHKETKMIAENAFYGCARVASIVIPEGVTSIGEYAFAGCSSLTSVVIPDGVTSIDNYTFEDCSSLMSVVIGDSVTSIGYSAFFNCTSLTSVYYKGSASDWKNISHDGGNSYLTNATRYYYSESQPTTTGRYWHYDENGKVVVW